MQFQLTRRGLFGLVLIAFSLLALAGGAENFVAVVDAAQSNTGTVTAAASTVSVTSRTVASSSCTSSCTNMTSGSTPPALTTVITGTGQTFYFSTNVHDSGGPSDVDQVTAYLYKATGGAVKGTFNQQKSYGFRWVRKGWSGSPACSTNGGCYQELTGSGWSSTLTNLVAGSSYHTTLSGSACSSSDCTWTFVFTFNWGSSALLPQFTTDHAWKYEADITNRAASSGFRSGTFDVNLYLSFSGITGLSWGTQTAGQTNATVPNLSTTWDSNANFQILVSGLGLNGSDTANIYNEFGDSFPLGYVYVCSTTPVGSCTASGSTTGFHLPQSPQALYSFTTGSAGVFAGQAETLYWFLTTPNPFPPGTYTFQYTVDYGSAAEPT